MEAIDFIESDIRRWKQSRALVRALIVGIALIPVLLGIGLRDSFENVFSLRIFVPNLLAAIVLGGVVFASFDEGFSSAKILKTAKLALLFALLLATERVLFPSGPRTQYASASVFWRESGRCFFKGALTSAVMGAWLICVAFVFSSLPARRWRILISVVCGVAGAVMLGFHCDSSSWGHVLSGHVFPGVVLGVLIYFAQETVFRLKLRLGFQGLLGKIRNPSRLG